MNEQQLIAQLCDEKTRNVAFGTLVAQYSEQLYWTARHIVGGHEDADDVVQNSFIKIWSRIGEFRGDSKLSTWLHRIVVNEALDFLRRERKHLDNDVALEQIGVAFADDYFDGDETERLLREAMETLPQAQRAVFSLRYYDDKPYKEISEILGTSEGGLKANYHHAVEKIKLFFEKH